MVKDLRDDRTVDLEGSVRRQRGRPVTGNAMTPAQRQAARRERLRAQGMETITVDISSVAADKLRQFVEFKDFTLGQIVDRLIVQQLARKR